CPFGLLEQRPARLRNPILREIVLGELQKTIVIVKPDFCAAETIVEFTHGSVQRKARRIVVNTAWPILGEKATRCRPGRGVARPFLGGTKQKLNEAEAQLDKIVGCPVTVVPKIVSLHQKSPADCVVACFRVEAPYTQFTRQRIMHV